MIRSSAIAFSFVTLSGIIALKLFRRRASCLKLQPHSLAEDVTEDIISQLPDAVLVSIIERLSTRDAIRTSILSKRWKKLYLFVPDVWFDCTYMVGSRKRHVARDRMFLFIDGVFSYLRLRLGSMAKIHTFRLTCCFARSFPDKVRHLISFLGRLGVVRVQLIFESHFECDGEIIFPFEFVSRIPSLELLSLLSCSLQPNFGSQYSSIKTIILCDVSCDSGVIGCILSSCLNLELLKLISCKLPSRLRISGPDLRLKCLRIDGCTNVEEIELNVGNLTTLECISCKMINISLDYVPQLQNLCLTSHERRMFPHAYGRLDMDLPHLKCLNFYINTEFYEELFSLLSANRFRNLRQLYLTFSGMFTFDLLSIAPFLHNCPLLEEFHLMIDEAAFDGPETSTIEFHPELKEVEINGFSGTQNEINFALYILKSAPFLERMYISRSSKSYRTSGKWEEIHRSPWSEETRKTIEDQLQGQALSENAKVTIALNCSPHNLVKSSCETV